MHQRMLDVEVVLVMKDGDLVSICLAAGGLLVLIGVAAIWGYRDGRQVNRGGGLRIAIDGQLSSSGSHGCECAGDEEVVEVGGGQETSKGRRGKSRGLLY